MTGYEPINDVIKSQVVAGSNPGRSLGGSPDLHLGEVLQARVEIPGPDGLITTLSPYAPTPPYVGLGTYLVPNFERVNFYYDQNRQ